MKVAGLVRSSPTQTAKGLHEEHGIPYDAANRALRELKNEGKYEPPFDRKKAMGRRSLAAAKRKEWLLRRARGKSVREIIDAAESPYATRAQVHKDIAMLRLEGKTIDVKEDDNIGVEVAMVEGMIRENGATTNSEMIKRVGLGSKGALRDRLRRADPDVLQSRIVPHSTFSRGDIAEQNRVIRRMARAGKKSREIAAELQSRFGAVLSPKQITQRISASSDLREATRGMRPIGRSRFGAEEINRQNMTIFRLSKQGMMPAQMVGRAGLDGLSRKDISDRLFRQRKRTRRK